MYRGCLAVRVDLLWEEVMSREKDSPEFFDGSEDEGYDPPEQPEDFDEYTAACDDAGIKPYGAL